MATPTKNLAITLNSAWEKIKLFSKHNRPITISSNIMCSQEKSLATKSPLNSNKCQVKRNSSAWLFILKKDTKKSIEKFLMIFLSIPSGAIFMISQVLFPWSIATVVCLTVKFDISPGKADMMSPVLLKMKKRLLQRWFNSKRAARAARE